MSVSSPTPRRASASSGRGAVVFSAALLLAGALAWWSFGAAPLPPAEAPLTPETPLSAEPSGAPPPSQPPEVVPTQPPSSERPGAPPGTTTSQAVLAGQPEPYDPAVGVIAPPPPLPGPDYVAPELPQPTPMSQDVFIERRAAGIDLLDDTLERLTHEQQEQERAGDHEAAHLTQVRITRMTALRARRMEELEAARAGELTPDSEEHGHEAQ